jgi:predicted deacylase
MSPSLRRNLAALGALAAAFLPPSALLAQGGSPRPSAIPVSAWVRIDAASPEALESALLAAGFDDEALEVEAHGVRLVVTPDEYQHLRALRLHPVVLELARPLYERLGELNDLEVPTGYLDNAQILAELQAKVAAHPTRARLVDIAATYGPGATYQGRPIWALVVSDQVALEEDEPKALIVAAHHCREIGTPVAVLYAIDQLLNGYASDPRSRALVDGYELWFVPVVNPDGYHHVFTADSFWRKNRRPFGSFTGVDLNRNYPLGWGGSCTGSTSPSSDTYKGPSAASEAETQSLIGLSRARRFERVLDFHSYGRETLYGYRCSTFPLQSWYQTEAVALSVAAGYGSSATRLASAEGEHYQWQLNEGGAYAFLTEMQTSFQPSYSSSLAESAQIWNEIRALLERATPARGAVRDAQTLLPLEVAITAPSIAYAMGERRSSAPDGRWFYWASAGTRALEFSREGYTTASETIAFSAAGTVQRDVALQPIVSVLAPQGVRIGRTAIFELESRSDAQRAYLGLPSLSATPIPLGAGRVLQGGFDILTELAYQGLFGGISGVLDTQGRAQMTLAVPADATLVGFSFVVNYVTLEASGTALRHVSQPLFATVQS